MIPNFDFESNFKMFESYLNRRSIKFKLIESINGYLVKIPKSQIEFVNRQGLIDEIKVVPPQRRISPEEYEIIYELLEGTRKPTSLDYDNIWGIDFNLISKDYFTKPGPLFFDVERYEELAEYLDKNNILLALRALPVIELENHNIHYRGNEAKYPKQQYYLLKYNNKFYFVNSRHDFLRLAQRRFSIPKFFQILCRNYKFGFLLPLRGQRTFG